jgi:putative ABC transport system permease protein
MYFLYGFSEDFSNIQPLISCLAGIYLQSEFQQGTNAAVIGNEVAEQLFVKPERAVGRMITTKGKKVIIVGVIKKQG